MFASVCLHLCLSVCVFASVCLHLCLSVCVFAFYVCLSVFLSIHLRNVQSCYRLLREDEARALIAEMEEAKRGEITCVMFIFHKFGSCDAEGDELRTKLSRKEKEYEKKELEMMETKSKLDQLLSKLDEAHQLLNEAKAKQTELANQLQDQTQKVQELFISHAFSHAHRMSCCRENVMQWKPH